MKIKTYQIIVLLPEYAQISRDYIPVLKEWQETQVHDLQWKVVEGVSFEPINQFLKNQVLRKVVLGKLTIDEMRDNLPGG